MPLSIHIVIASSSALVISPLLSPLRLNMAVLNCCHSLSLTLKFTEVILGYHLLVFVMIFLLEYLF